MTLRDTEELQFDAIIFSPNPAVPAYLQPDAIMGALIGLQGPTAPAVIANQARARNDERKQDGRRHDDTRRAARQHAYLLEIMMTIQAFKGFLVLHASARNDIWKFNSVRSWLNIPELDFHVFDLAEQGFVVGLRCYAIAVPLEHVVFVRRW